MSPNRRGLLLSTVALTAAMLVIVGVCRHHQRTFTYQDEEAYAVYSAILPGTNPLVVRESTTTYEMCLRPLDSQAEEVLRPALEDYLKLNSAQWRLRQPQSGQRQYTLFPETELQSTFPSGTSGLQSAKGWESFMQRHPTYQGWMELSAVGFNHDKTIAIVYIGYHCGDECAGGEFKALQKQNGTWQRLTGKGLWNHCSWRRRDWRAATALAPKPS